MRNSAKFVLYNSYPRLAYFIPDGKHSQSQYDNWEKWKKEWPWQKY